MSYELTLDIVDVGEVSEDLVRGFRAQRKAIVSGMTAITPAAKMVRALTLSTVQTSSGELMPRLGDPYPGLPFIICINRTARLIGDKGACEVYLDYGVPDVSSSPPSDTAPPQIEVGATVQEVTTRTDINNVLMVVSYTRPLAPGEVGPVQAVPQTGEISKSIPSVYFRYRRRETQSPGDNAKRYVGKMNSQTWANDPAKYWLCTGITGTSSDNGASYDVVYEFLRNDETWDGKAFWIGEDGRIPSNVTSTNGIKVFEIYQSDNFSNLIV